MKLTVRRELSTHDSPSPRAGRTVSPSWCISVSGRHTVTLNSSFSITTLSPGRSGALTTPRPPQARPFLTYSPCPLPQANSCSGTLFPESRLSSPQRQGQGHFSAPRPHASLCSPRGSGLFGDRSDSPVLSRPLGASKRPCAVSSRWMEDGPNPSAPAPVSAGGQHYNQLPHPTWVLTPSCLCPRECLLGRSGGAET